MPWIIRILMLVAASIAGLFVARDTLNFDISSNDDRDSAHLSECWF
jgi:hypothetical protein